MCPSRFNSLFFPHSFSTIHHIRIHFQHVCLFNRYLGEVVTEEIMHDRSETDYKEEHHEYCMSLGNGEVIDATRKVRRDREENWVSSIIYTVQMCTVWCVNTPQQPALVLVLTFPPPPLPQSHFSCSSLSPSPSSSPSSSSSSSSSFSPFCKGWPGSFREPQL